MPEDPRFGWRVLLVSTVLAGLAAAATYVLLDGGDGADDATGPDVTLPLIDDADPGALTRVAFTEFDGADVALGELRGRPVVLNFFASTCVPCVTEMPAFEEVHGQLGERVTFLGLAMQDRVADALGLVDRTGVTYRTAQDPDGAVFRAVGGIVLPTTVLLDAEGRLVDAHAGALDADQLRAWLDDELGISP